jgi:SAM-dependent methyltransferase/spore maturation protein CgeB
MSTSDRISELYHRELFDWSTQERARERIHWMCAQVRGRRVLDLGCSQGIVSILLGREGFEVTGVDVDPEQIQEACAAIEKEPPGVKERVTFQVGDGSALEFEDGAFDTLVAGELLEHLTQPERMLQQMARLLAPGGRAVISVPFGLHPHPDHKQTFYLPSFIDLVETALKVSTVELRDKYILLVAGRRDEAALPVAFDRSALSRQAEQAMEAIELEVHAAIEERARKARGMRNKAQELQEQSLESARETEELQRENRSLERRIEEVDAERQRLKSELDAVQRELTHAVEACANAEQGLRIDRQRLDEAEAELARLEADCRRFEQEAQQNRREARTARVELERLQAESARLSGDNEKLRQERQRVSSLLDRAGVERGHPATRLDRFVNRHRKLARLHEKTVAGLRFRIGDAFVDAATPSIDTLALPFRMANLFFEGLHKLSDQRNTEQAPVRAEIGTKARAELEPTRTKPGAAAAAADPKRELDLVARDRPESPAAVRVGCVLDEFSTDCFGPECRLVKPRPDNWEAVLGGERPHLLFAESAWKGNDGAWQYRVAEYAAPPGRELAAMVKHCRRQGLPTVFWNKEDPVHYERFLAAAGLFDVVLTSDSRCVEHYRQTLGHDRVAALPFAAQPRLQNPIALPDGRNRRICFAGSYYANRHAERRREMEMLLDAAAGPDLDIYDRNFGLTGPGSEHFAFPERFQHHIVGRLPYRDLMRAYRRYRVFLNVNSVIDSPTMFSRRVFELLACGTPVVSTWSEGVAELLGHDAVWLVRSEREARTAIRTLLEDDGEWRRRRLLGIRRVLGAHTYRHRFTRVLEHAGLTVPGDEPPQVLWVGRARGPRELERLLQDFDRQSWPRRCLALLLAEGLVAPQREDVIALSGDAPGEALEALLAEPACQLVGRQRADCLYGAHYLEDLVLAHGYSRAAVVAKSNAADRFLFQEPVHPAAHLIDHRALTPLGWRPSELLAEDGEDWRRFGASVFVADAAEFEADFSRWDDAEAVARAVADCEL